MTFPSYCIKGLRVCAARFTPPKKKAPPIGRADLFCSRRKAPEERFTTLPIHHPDTVNHEQIIIR